MFPSRLVQAQAHALRRAELDRLAGVAALKWKTFLSRMRAAFAARSLDAPHPCQVAPTPHP
jgi:hypothetical protein